MKPGLKKTAEELREMKESGTEEEKEYVEAMELILKNALDVVDLTEEELADLRETVYEFQSDYQI